MPLLIGTVSMILHTSMASNYGLARLRVVGGYGERVGLLLLDPLLAE